MRLGPKFLDLLVAYQRQHQHPRRSESAALSQRGHLQGRLPADAPIARSFLWNPRLTDMVDCRRLSRPAPYRIGFSNASSANPWRIAMLHGMLHFAKRHSSRISRFIVTDAEDDSARQSADIESLLREKVDLLLVSCNQASQTDAALAMAAHAHVPVVAVDRRPTRDEHFLSYVSASDIALGRITAQWLVEQVGGRGTIFMLAGIKGSSPAEYRGAAASEVFSQHPEIIVTDVRYTDWREELGCAFTKELVRQHGIPAGVWCDSGLQGAGSMQAFLDLGVPPSQIPPHTGGDVNHAFQLADRHGIALAAVEYPAWMGARALQTGLDALSGRIIPRRVEVHSQIIVSQGCETPSVRADILVGDYARWDRPADFVASHGLGDAYSPDRFHVDHLQ